MIQKELLDILCCPLCHSDLQPKPEESVLVCTDGHRFPIHDSVPILNRDSESSPYDALYRQVNFTDRPFGYKKAYAQWRKGQINRKVVAYLQPGTVLDNGGGYGYLQEFLDPAQHTYYNLDCSYEILKYDTSVYRCVGEGEALPFKDAVFDNVTSGDVLEHVQDKVAYIAESYRILKPNGIFILNTPREGWVEDLKHSGWFGLFLLNRLWSKIKRKPAPKADSSQGLPEGVVDIPSDETWLREQLEKQNYEILVQTRTDNHALSLTNWFWRKFADWFINTEKYGHCVYFACKKK
jgi:ubiquinone/menaquinone biosynthesis C-methylase UbiE/uncharacterized protein YbaR (Trm112 family)